MKGLVLLVLLAWSTAAAGAAVAPTADETLYAGWRPLLARAAADGQADDPVDLYKLLFQGVLGPAHAAPAEQEAVAWLAQEWGAMAEEPSAPLAPWPLLEPIRPDSLLVRVHLRPLAAMAVAADPMGGRARALADAWGDLARAFVRTARAWPGDRALLERLWRRADADRLLWPAGADSAARAEVTAALAAAAWPAVHHSDAFTRARGPHYRVVARDELPAGWLTAAGWPPRRVRAPEPPR